MSHKDTVNPLKGLSLTEESFIENFLDKKITKQASMTSELRSTLKSLESRINIPGKEVLTEVDINISESEN